MLSERLSLCLRPALLADLKRLADERELSLSDVVRSCLRERLAAERRVTAERQEA